MDRADLIGRVAAVAGAGWIAAYWLWQPGGDPAWNEPRRRAVQVSAPERAAESERAVDEAPWESADPDPEPEPPRAGRFPPTPPPVPPPPPTATPAADPALTRQYVVRSGDTVEGIAIRELGSALRKDEILRLNPEVDPRRLRLGSTLRLPALGPASAADPAVPSPASGAGEAGGAGATPEQVHVVAPGDTLSAVSERYYGSTQYADGIFQANRDVLRTPHELRPGQRLRIPPRP